MNAVKALQTKRQAWDSRHPHLLERGAAILREILDYERLVGEQALYVDQADRTGRGLVLPALPDNEKDLGPQVRCDKWIATQGAWSPDALPRSLRSRRADYFIGHLLKTSTKGPDGDTTSQQPPPPQPSPGSSDLGPPTGAV